MSSERPLHAELVRTLKDEMRQLTAESVMFDQIVAQRLGLNVTDLRCWDILCRTGPVTAGQLADITGLTTGAITGVVDRLEAGGFVQRERDPSDRRRVIVQTRGDREAEAGQLYESIATSMSALCARYSEQELAVILDFINRCHPLMRQETTHLRRESTDPAV